LGTSQQRSRRVLLLAHAACRSSLTFGGQPLVDGDAEVSQVQHGAQHSLHLSTTPGATSSLSHLTTLFDTPACVRASGACALRREACHAGHACYVAVQALTPCS
jgi:hypothetical protein